jgi:hypothetical protein
VETTWVVAPGVADVTGTLEGLFEVQPGNTSRKVSRIETIKIFNLFMAPPPYLIIS